jgi:integrase
LWRVFSQIRTKDHDFLPAVLTRQQVHNLLGSIRLRRYRTPIKLIYCCGLRLGECLSLTIHDILGDERRLVIRNSKGHQDRVIPLAAPMLEDLRNYWSFHRHPRWLFPNVGRGDQTPEALAERMRSAKTPMPYSSLQRLIIVARKQLNLPAASIHFAAPFLCHASAGGRRTSPHDPKAAWAQTDQFYHDLPAPDPSDTAGCP